MTASPSCCFSLSTASRSALASKPSRRVASTWMPSTATADAGQVGGGAGSSLGLDRLQFPLQFLLAIEQGAQLVAEFGTGAAEQVGGFAQALLLGRDMVERALPAHRLDPAHAGGHATFGHDLEQADVARAGDVRAAAKLGRGLAHAQHAHALAVLLAEQGHRAEVERFLHVHVVDFGRMVAADLGIDLALDQRQFVGADRLEVREVEAQAIGCDQRALLGDMVAEHFAQGRVQQVRRAVVEHGRGATRVRRLRRPGGRRA